MKRFMTTALAALVIAGPLSVGAASAQSWRGDSVREERRDVRDARRDLREERRELRRAQRWNRQQHNGYYLGGRFYYGEPSYQHLHRGDYRPAWQQWRRGDRLPYYAREHYREVDWRRHGYRQPPRGYHYVRDDRGEVLLVGIATGVILGLILGN